jgi:L-fuconolactonase
MIDAHQHLWTLGSNGCVWPTANDGPIFRDVSLDDFRAEAAPLGVTGTILVQSQEDERDTAWLLGIADEEELVSGVVGWTDLTAGAGATRIAALAAHEKLVGLRPMVQHRGADWYDRPELDPSLMTMIDHGLSLDALVRGRHLASLDRLAGRYPELRVVIDHAAKPEIERADGFGQWRAAIAPLADRPNIYCKLSGLLTECGAAPAEAVEPYVHAIIDLFGPERVMWGSDWPVLELASGYCAWLGLCLELVPGHARDAVFGGTARRFYALEARVHA